MSGTSRKPTSRTRRRRRPAGSAAGGMGVSSERVGPAGPASTRPTASRHQPVRRATTTAPVQAPATRGEPGGHRAGRRLPVPGPALGRPALRGPAAASRTDIQIARLARRRSGAASHAALVCRLLVRRLSRSTYPIALDRVPAGVHVAASRASAPRTCCTAECRRSVPLAVPLAVGLADDRRAVRRPDPAAQEAASPGPTTCGTARAPGPRARSSATPTRRRSAVRASARAATRRSGAVRAASGPRQQSQAARRRSQAGRVATASPRPRAGSRQSTSAAPRP